MFEEHATREDRTHKGRTRKMDKLSVTHAFRRIVELY